MYILFGGNSLKEYKVKEVADLLGKHEETIKRWIRSGKFPNENRFPSNHSLLIFYKQIHHQLYLQLLT
ncbi:helix-turn-helix domain-containing protein [Lysinibacillus sp. NPDC059133]|uniref:helix-turn-helix domain-containing protein n=1 Tax=Lysinibacillus sp. NPDC059133 TaxID=3346737 RepID=UPI003697C409